MLLILLPLDPIQRLLLCLVVILRLGVPPGLEVAFRSPLARVVHVLGVCFEGDLATATRAADVEAVDGNGEVFFFGCFFARVEFAAAVDVFSYKSKISVRSNLLASWNSIVIAM